MATSPVMSWLAAGVPLALLCDLVSSTDPRSIEICAVERPSNDPMREEAARDGRVRSALA